MKVPSGIKEYVRARPALKAVLRPAVIEARRQRAFWSDPASIKAFAARPARGLKEAVRARSRLKALVMPAYLATHRYAGWAFDMARVSRMATRSSLQMLRGRSCIASFRSDAKIGRSPAGDRSVVMIGIVDLLYDPRIEREARALASRGYKVTIVFPKSMGWDEAKLSWGDNIFFDPAPTHTGDYAYAGPGLFDEELYQWVAKYHPFAFHAHDLNTAFIGIAAAKKTGAHLICDFHEWFSENVTYDVGRRKYRPHSKWRRRLYQWLERTALSESSAVVTVCDSIADAMGQELGEGRRPVVVRNIPALSATPTKSYPPLKKQLGLPEDRFVLLWQGGTGPSRLIEPIIEALRFAPKCTFVIRGPSLDAYGEGYMAIAARGGFTDRLILQPPVPSRDVVAAGRGADAGVWTLPNLSRNFSYALPNKIFEYIASGLPLLVADYPEARRVVEKHQLGYTFDPYDPQSIAEKINRLVDDPASRKRYAHNTKIALEAMDAEREWLRLVDIYDALPAGAAAGR